MPRRPAALIAIAVAAWGCGGRPPEPLPALFDRAARTLVAGRLDVAALAAQQGRDRAARAGDVPVAWRFRLLQAEVLQAQGRGDEAAALVGAPMPLSLAVGPLGGRREKILAHRARLAGRFGEALDHLDRAANLAGQDRLLSLEILVTRASTVGELGENELSERLMRQAERLAIVLDQPRWRAAALNNRGCDWITEGRCDRALPLLEAAEIDLRRAGAETLRASVLANLGMCYVRLGDLARSRSLLVEALAVQERAGAGWKLASSVGELGKHHAFLGEHAVALGYFERALALARTHAPLEVSRWSAHLAETHLALGQVDQAARHNQEAARLASAAKDDELIAHTRLNAAAIAHRRGDLAGAGRLYQALLAGSDQDAGFAFLEAEAAMAGLAGEEGRDDEADRWFIRAVDRLERTRAELDRLDNRLTFLTRPVRIYQEQVDRLMTRGREAEALGVVETSRGRLLEQRLARGALTGPTRGPGAVAAELQERARRRGETFLSYWVAPRRSFAWLVDGDGIVTVPLPGDVALRGLVERYRSFIEHSLRDPRQVPASGATELYQTLVAPFGDRLRPGRTVVVTADGPLHSLPFAALVVPGPRPVYWIEQVTLAATPALPLLSPAPAAGTGRGALVIGDPVTGEPDFPPLPHAAAEIQAVTRRFPGRVLVGPAARPEAYLQAGRGPLAILHFAAHALANPTSPLDSAIVLSPGGDGNRLTVRDVLEAGVAADLVTVSTCRGAGVRAFAGEGLVGFAWAFLSSGSGQVVAGLWDVPDRSTTRLMDIFYAQIAAGRSAAAALREAQRALIATAGPARNPYAWAAFQVYVGAR